ncbi:MAG: hypothetical protein KKA90_04425 [Nanoarchaeota archaeon]|nr:hypothetical protein [Nanoarchaeota archaeon]
MVYRILADSPETVPVVKAALEKLNPLSIEEQELAFGMKALLFKKVIPDEGGAQDKLEEQLQTIPHLSDFEVLSFSRSMA